MADIRQCPKCHSENVFRSRRRSIEYLLPFIRPYRCYSCERRFLMFAHLTKAQRVRLEHSRVSEKNIG